jgi:hypothetical protein
VIELEVLTRAGCGLCSELEEALDEALAGHPARCVRRSVDDYPALARRFGHHVPVVRVGGEVLCAHRLDRARLAAALAGERWEPLELR